MSKKEIVKKVNDVILGGKMTKGRNFKTGKTISISGRDIDYKKEIEKIPKDKRVEKFTSVNKATGTSMELTLDRNGTTDEKLAMVLADKDSSDELKASTLSLYLFEKGKESSSYILDLMTSKGRLFKTNEQFKSELRLDFNIFVNMFCNFLSSISDSIINTFGVGLNAELLLSEYLESAEKKRGLSISSFLDRKFKIQNLSNEAFVLIEMAIRYADEANVLRKEIQNIAEERERARGKGIHLDKFGKAFKE